MATKLKHYREKARLTQAELARRAIVSERSYNSHEVGKGGACRPWTQTLIAKALNVPVGTLFTKGGRAR